MSASLSLGQCRAKFLHAHVHVGGDNRQLRVVHIVIKFAVMC